MAPSRASVQRKDIAGAADRAEPTALRRAPPAHPAEAPARLPAAVEWIEREMAAAAAAPSPGMHRNRTEETPVLSRISPYISLEGLIDFQ